VCDSGGVLPDSTIRTVIVIAETIFAVGLIALAAWFSLR
jgi:hypothetical protein